MAEKRKRNFELGKKAEHKFEINKGSGRKFDINKGFGDEEETLVIPADEGIEETKAVVSGTEPEKDTEATQIIALTPKEEDAEATKINAKETSKTEELKEEPILTNDTEIEESSDNGSKKWLLAVLAILIIGVLAWWFMSKDEDLSASQEEPIQIDNIDSQSGEQEPEQVADESSTLGQVANGAQTEDNAAMSSEDGLTASPNVSQETIGEQHSIGTTDNSPVAENSAPASDVDGKQTVSPASHESVAGNTEPIVSTTPQGTVAENAIGLEGLTLEEKANLVIRGDFGNGEERKKKLGAQYKEIQAKVNEMYSQGLVY